MHNIVTGHFPERQYILFSYIYRVGKKNWWKKGQIVCLSLT